MHCIWKILVAEVGTTDQYDMLHMMLMEWFWVALRVAHTSMGTNATIEMEVIHPSSTSILANQCTLGAANRLSLQGIIAASLAFHGLLRRIPGPCFDTPDG